MTRWLARYRHLRHHDIWALIYLAAGSAASVALTLFQFPFLNETHWMLATLAVIAPLAAASEALTRGNINQDAEERAKRQGIIRNLVEETCGTAIRLMSSRPDSTGCMVFQQRSDGILYPEFAFNKEGQPDRNISFEPLVGCTGHAWHQGEQVRASLQEASRAELSLTWKLSAEQIGLTAHLRTIISTPIWDTDNPGRIIGVVTVDSTEEEPICGITSDESADEALQLAALLARLLKLAE